MKTASQMHDMPVLDVDGGQKLGKVDELVVSPDDGRLLGIVVASGGLLDRKSSVLRAADIRSIGPDAVTVEGEDAIQPEDADPQIRDVLKGDRRFSGRKVVTRNGTALGEVSDVAIDESSLRLSAVIVRKGLVGGGDPIAADRIVSIGPDVLVVRAESADNEAPTAFVANDMAADPGADRQQDSRDDRDIRP